MMALKPIRRQDRTDTACSGIVGVTACMAQPHARSSETHLILKTMFVIKANENGSQEIVSSLRFVDENTCVCVCL